MPSNIIRNKLVTKMFLNKPNAFLFNVNRFFYIMKTGITKYIVKEIILCVVFFLPRRPQIIST